MTAPQLFSTFPVWSQVFFRSSLSAGIVNLKPLVPGHVLVIPSRVTSRLSDLSPSECSDLFLSVQTVSRALEKRYDAKSMTIAIQDGPLAGQTVPHLHVHVMPRFKGDFDPLDKVYDALDELDLSAAQKEILAKEERKERVVVDDEKRFARTKEVMDDEARELSLLFPLENRGQ